MTTNSIFAERLKSARAMQGLSLAALAATMGKIVTKQALSKYERGSAMPGDAVMLKLAAALRLPIEYFFRQPSSMTSLEFRKRCSLPATVAKMIKERARDAAERQLQIEALFDFGNRFVNPVVEMVSDGDGIEAIAQSVRQSWKLGQDALPDVVELLESNGIIVVLIDTHKDFDGMSFFAPGGRCVIALNPELSIERRRFTAMHELGHLLLNFPTGIGDADKEKLCHRFAGAMLLPWGAMVQAVGNQRRWFALREMIEVKERYGISISAFLARAKERSIISDNVYKKLYLKYISKNRNEADMGRYSSREKPTRFTQLIYRALSEEMITMSRAAELSNVSLECFRNEYLAS